MRESENDVRGQEEKTWESTAAVITIPEQIENLRGLGLEIEDEKKASDFLENVSCYRLNGYSVSLRGEDGKFRPGATFDTLVALHEFDSSLRRPLFGAIEKIELAFRTRLVNYVSSKYGPTGYLDYNNFDLTKLKKDKKKDGKDGDGAYGAAEEMEFGACEWDGDEEPKTGPCKNGKRNPERRWAVIVIEEIIGEFSRNSKHKINPNGEHCYYDVDIPFCAAAEYVSFGKLSRFYENMLSVDKAEFCQEHYPGTDSRHFESWLDSIGYLRNMCAHHNRLYGAEMRIKPMAYASKGGRRDLRETGSLYGVMQCMRRLAGRGDWERFVEDLGRLVAEHPEADVSKIGFPTEWESGLLQTEQNESRRRRGA